MRKTGPVSSFSEGTSPPRSAPSYRLLCSVLLVALCCSPAIAIESGSTAVDCDDLQTCLGRVTRVNHDGVWFSDEEEALAKRLQSFGAEAIPELIALLSAPDERTRRFAGYTLRDIEGLEPRHAAPILRAALEQYDGGSLPFALARIGTPEAIAGLASLARKYPPLAATSSISEAFEYLGPKGVPALVQLVDGAENQNLRDGAGGILIRLGPNASDAVGSLAKIVADKNGRGRRTSPRRSDG